MNRRNNGASGMEESSSLAAKVKDAYQQGIIDALAHLEIVGRAVAFKVDWQPGLKAFEAMEKKKLVPKCLKDFVCEMNREARVDVNVELALISNLIEEAPREEKQLSMKKGNVLEPIEVDEQKKEQEESRERWMKKIMAEFQTHSDGRDLSMLLQGHTELADNLLEQNLLWETTGKGVIRDVIAGRISVVNYNLGVYQHI